MSDEILVVRCGLVSYEEALVVQRWLANARQEGEVSDVLLLLEHPPVYTRGRRSTDEELPMQRQWYEMQGIEVRDTDRGGRVTYHGPGQLVAYPIVSLKPYGDDVHEYVRRLERVAIEALAEHGVSAQTIEGLTGVWTQTDSRRDENASIGDVLGPAAAGARKIGSIGIHVSRGVTTHGLAINVNNDLQPFEWIVPCGIDNCRVTSLGRELGGEQDFAAVTESVVQRYGEIFERAVAATEPAALGLDSARLGIA